MSIIKKTKCDVCGMETEDYYSESGWIVIAASDFNPIEVTICIGRDDTGQARTVYEQFKTLDFCSIDCLVVFIQKKLDESPWEAVTEEGGGE